VKRVLGGLEGKLLGILGLTFKPNTDDIRESPAIKIIMELQKEGARIAAFDPAGMSNAQKVLREVTFVEDIYDVAAGADALMIITEWNQFRFLDWEKLKSLLKSPTVIDLRNIYEPSRMKEMGFNYHCVGRYHE